MTKEEIKDKITTIFRDVLDDNSIVLKDETTANDVEEWDSLNHIQLVVAIEKQFSMRFTSQEIQNWKNVGEMCDDILLRIK